MMDCDRVREQLPDYWMGALDQRGRAEVDAHLAVCSTCQEDAAMWARLGALPEEQPSAALAARFEGMLAAYGTEAKPPRRRFTFSIPVLQFSIAMACLLAGIGIGYLVAGRGASNKELARLREEVHNTRQLVALSLLEQQSASGRLRGVTWSTRLEQPDKEVLSALLQTVKSDSSVDVRLSAVDALRRYAGLPMVQKGLLEALQGPQSPLVQIALIDLMVEARDRDALGALQQLRADKTAHEAVRQRAAWGIQQF